MTSGIIAAIIETTGNPHGHVILRGGSETGPQYNKEWVDKTCALLNKAKLPANVVVDCSHANSSKKPENQPLVRSYPTRVLPEWLCGVG